jgi:hypothetical protein
MNAPFTIVSSRQLIWRKAGNGYSLHFERRSTPLLHVVPDEIHSGMFRIRLSDGELSDIANLSRARDAGITHGLGILNRKSRQGTAPGSSHSDTNSRE